MPATAGPIRKGLQGFVGAGGERAKGKGRIDIVYCEGYTSVELSLGKWDCYTATFLLFN
jgi:hypothetical protein